MYYPLWLIYAACVAEKNGFEVAFIDAPAEADEQGADAGACEEGSFDAKLFVFDHQYIFSIYSDVEFAGIIKKMYPNAFTMLVGTHPSATPDETMGISELIDGLARHEYDYIVRDTAIAIRDGADLATVRGLTYRKDGEVVHNPDAEHITDLDEIPYAAEFIKRRLCVTDYVFPAAAFPSIQIFTGRGCQRDRQLLCLSSDAAWSSLSSAQSGKCHW